MQRKQLDIDELYDLLAVRVIVDNLIQLLYRFRHCPQSLAIHSERI